MEPDIKSAYEAAVQEILERLKIRDKNSVANISRAVINYRQSDLSQIQNQKVLLGKAIKHALFSQTDLKMQEKMIVKSFVEVMDNEITPDRRRNQFVETSFKNITNSNRNAQDVYYGRIFFEAVNCRVLKNHPELAIK